MSAVCGTCRHWGGHAYPDTVVKTHDGQEHHVAVGQCKHPSNAGSWYSLAYGFTCTLHEPREDNSMSSLPPGFGGKYGIGTLEDKGPREDLFQPIPISQSDRLRAIGTELGELVAAKNLAYGSSFHRIGGILREIYPDGIKPDQYGDMLAIARITDKLFRLATDPDAFAEDPAMDLAGYGILLTDVRRQAKAMNNAI